MLAWDIEVLYLIILAQLGKEVITKVSFQSLNHVYTYLIIIIIIIIIINDQFTVWRCKL